MKVHRLAKYFPVLEGEEFDLLVKDIEINGQLEPIVMVGDEVLDGINRYRACEQLGVRPKTVEFSGTDAKGYVVSMNIMRRHLNKGQVALLLNEIYPANGVQSLHPKTVPGMAKSYNVGTRTIRQARRIQREAPEKIQDIMQGKTSVDAVESELRKAKANEIAKENKEKGLTKEKEKRESREYKAYLEATKSYKHELEIAISYANDGLLPPESQGFITKRHEDIYELMAKLEDSYEYYQRTTE